MAIENNTAPASGNNFAREFGKMQGSGSAPAAAKTDRPKAKFWMNIGLMTQVPNEEGTLVDHFVALPQGIPLDTMEPLEVKGQNVDFRSRLTAQNDLLDNLKKKAEEEIAPGEYKVYSFGNGLQVQIRHVAAEAAPIESTENRYSVALAF